MIVDDIDWECEVHHFYSEENKGMHYIAMTAFKKTFEIVDRLIFLEAQNRLGNVFVKFLQIKCINA